MELNVGAELLSFLRSHRGMKKAYLRGLTQREEKQEGVDSFLQLPNARFFAFQFKAPWRGVDSPPYRYTLVREQHDNLYRLAQKAPDAVYYVLPFFATMPKLRQEVPNLLKDTWFMRVHGMQTSAVFSANKTKVIRCCPGFAWVNPRYETERFIPDTGPSSREFRGISVEDFAEWYEQVRQLVPNGSPWRNLWLSRGLRIAVVPE